VAGASLAIAAFLILVARPLAVFVGLSFTRHTVREKLLVSWVGLRGATPIILATFPLLAGLPEAQLIFNVVFFVVLTSVLIQGTTIPQVARWLRLAAPPPEPVALSLREHISEHLLEIELPARSAAAGKRIIDLRLPPQALLVLISRDGQHVVPTGSTVLREGDHVLITTEQTQVAEQVRQKLL